MAASARRQPAVMPDLPRCALGARDTPLLPAPELGKLVGGPRLFIKRDDLIGFGFGGNKVRALEFLLADALAERADTLLTGAGVQSNHVRATAAAAAYAGLGMIAVYWGAPPGRVEGNYRLTRLLGAETRFTGAADRASVDRALAAVAQELRQAGRRPYVIPRGGASARGVVGYMHAAQEIAGQVGAAGLESTVVLLAVGSGTTLAGLLLGAKRAGLPLRIEGFTVSRPASEARAQVLNLARQAADFIGGGVHLTDNDVVIHDGFIGAGYGVPTAEGGEAIRMAARHQGIFFDPTYTGKAFAGYLAHLRQGRFDAAGAVIFLHSGGEPGLFAGEGT
jgi:D-cysteine desulfhydrase